MHWLGKCCEAACGGRVCVDLSAPCNAAHDDGYAVSVRAAGTSTVLGSATTDPSGVACVDLAPELEYPVSVDVRATKAGCKTLTWGAVSVGCTGTTDLTAAASCGANAATYNVRGCFNTNLPGALVTLTRPSTGHAYSALTDASGNATVYGEGAGADYRVVISAEGFDDRVIDPATLTACGGGSGSVTLTVASTHVCCQVQKIFGAGGWSAYPIPKTLTLTDDQGSMVVTLSGCAGSACAVRNMDDVSSRCAEISTPCGGGVAQRSPPPIAAGSSAVTYEIDLSPGGFPGVNVAQRWGGFTEEGIVYRPIEDPCPAQPGFRRIWRCELGCGDATNRSTLPTTVDVVSLHPLLITATWSQPWAGGPVPGSVFPIPISAGPPISSLTISG